MTQATLMPEPISVKALNYIKECVTSARLLFHRPKRRTVKLLKSIDAPVIRWSSYSTVELLAYGNYSRVYTVTKNRRSNKNEKSNVPVCAAKVSLSTGSASALRDVLMETALPVQSLVKEVEILKLVQNNDRVVAFHECFYRIHRGEEEMWLIMEYLPLTLDEFQSLGRRLSEEEVSAVACGMINALEHVHSKGIMHLDIKGGNILLSEEGHVKLCDFGLSREFVKGEKKVVTGEIGTPCTMAVEFVESGSHYDESVDIWSLGVTLFMATFIKEDKPSNFELLQKYRNTEKRMRTIWMFWDAYEVSNDRYFRDAFNVPILSLANSPSTKWEDCKQYYPKGPSGKTHHAHYLTYPKVYEFCGKSVIPLPHEGTKLIPVKRKDTLDRASLEDLKTTSLVNDLLGMESEQRSILKATVAECQLALSKKTTDE